MSCKFYILKSAFLFLLGFFTLLACESSIQRNEQTGISTPVNQKDTLPPSGLKDDLPLEGVNSAFSTKDAAVPVPAAGMESLTEEDWVMYLCGAFDPAKDERFVLITKPYTNDDNTYLRKECFEAFKKMWEAARAEGVYLNIISATRNFYRQKAIWERKWNKYASTHPDPTERALKILEYSSMPGSSRHHWGTDIDLNDLENSSFKQGGRYEKEYKWLQAHAHEYGFCQPYSPKGDERPNGYNEERWHWSYLPLARPFTEEYRQRIKSEMIRGFKGSETAKDVKIIEHYVLGINKECTN